VSWNLHDVQDVLGLVVFHGGFVVPKRARASARE
jgi:hypothetical protein